jgi:hypothetical protein
LEVISMASELSTEELQGMELDQAVVRVKWPDASLNQWATNRYAVFDSPNHNECLSNTSCATEPEAWADASGRVIKEAGYSFSNITALGGDRWRWYEGEVMRQGPICSTRNLALDSAKRDYVARHTEDKAESAEDDLDEVCANCGNPHGKHAHHDGACPNEVWFSATSRFVAQRDPVAVASGAEGGITQEEQDWLDRTFGKDGWLLGAGGPLMLIAQRRELRALQSTVAQLREQTELMLNRFDQVAANYSHTPNRTSTHQQIASMLHDLVEDERAALAADAKGGR